MKPGKERRRDKGLDLEKGQRRERGSCLYRNKDMITGTQRRDKRKEL
jgi:hypothetical protein